MDYSSWGCERVGHNLVTEHTLRKVESAILGRVEQEGLPEEVTFVSSFEGNEGQTSTVLGKNITGSGNRRCKGPEAGAGLL